MTGRRLHPSVHRRTCVGANDVELIADGHGDPDDPVVLLLHGGGQTHHSWGSVAETLLIGSCAAGLAYFAGVALKGLVEQAL